MELSASGALRDNLTLNAAYTYTDSTQPDGLGGLRDEIRRPRHTASLNLAWQATDKLHINTNAQFSGSQTDEFFVAFPAEIVSLDDYLLLNEWLTTEQQKSWMSICEWKTFSMMITKKSSATRLWVLAPALVCVTASRKRL